MSSVKMKSPPRACMFIMMFTFIVLGLKYRLFSGLLGAETLPHPFTQINILTITMSHT